MLCILNQRQRISSRSKRTWNFVVIRKMKIGIVNLRQFVRDVFVVEIWRFWTDVIVIVWRRCDFPHWRHSSFSGLPQRRLVNDGQVYLIFVTVWRDVTVRRDVAARRDVTAWWNVIVWYNVTDRRDVTAGRVAIVWRVVTAGRDISDAVTSTF